jgi:AraC-like DNA-binding protein
MENLMTWKIILYLNSIAIGLLVSIVLIVFGYRKNKYNITIGLSYFFLTYGVFIAFLIHTGYFSYFPYLFRTGNIAGLLFSPLAYLYIRQVCLEQNLSWKDAIHFLPVMIYLVDFFPVIFLMNVQDKLQVITAEIKNPVVFVSYNQTRFFSSFFYTQGRTLLILVYWIASIRLLHKYSKPLIANSKDFGKEWVTWMKIYVFSFSVLVVPYYSLLIFSSKVEIIFDLTHLTGSVLLFFSGVTILFFPRVLYGLNKVAYQQAIVEKETIKHAVPDEISEEKKSKIEQCLFKVLDQDKKYLQKNYTIHELAKDMDVPFYLLSYYINKVLGVTFLDLINSKRITEGIRMLEAGATSQYTLEAIAKECGFSNRNTFVAAFKKFHHMTPSQFAKNLKLKGTTVL